jgi:hypothetical protein
VEKIAKASQPAPPASPPAARAEKPNAPSKEIIVQIGDREASTTLEEVEEMLKQLEAELAKRQD